jgi:small subunit ribosomal protein S16
MVRIRLRRVGLRNQPSYRIVVADKEAPRDGRFLEIVGFYNPRTEPATIEFDEERIYDWLSKGAQPSEPISRLFKVVNLMDRFKRYKAGEPVDKILADAKAFYDARVVSPRTRRDAAVVIPSKKKAAARATAEAAPKSTPVVEVKPVEAIAEPVVEAVAAPAKAEAVEVVVKPVVEVVAAPVEAEAVKATVEPVTEAEAAPDVEVKAVVEPVVEVVAAPVETVTEAVAEPAAADTAVEVVAEPVATEAAPETPAPEAAPAGKAKGKKAKS